MVQAAPADPLPRLAVMLAVELKRLLHDVPDDWTVSLIAWDHEEVICSGPDKSLSIDLEDGVVRSSEALADG